MSLLRILASVLLGLLSACGSAQLGAHAPQPGRCLLLTSNDSESNFDGPRVGSSAPAQYAGTIARIAAEKQLLLRARSGAVLLVEGGDVLQGRYMERQDGDRPLAMQKAWQVYEAAGYDYATIGNHEFDAGPKSLRTALRGLSTLRILSANLAPVGTSLDPAEPGRPQGLFGRTAVASCGGIAVGLFGLTTPSTRTISQLGDVKFASDPIVGPAREAVRALRAQGATVVVALSHLGVDDDLQLARDVTGIDAIVGGHSHTRLPTAQRVGPTWVTQTGSRFSHLGYLDLATDTQGQLDAATSSWRLRPVPELQAVDENLNTRIASLRATLVAEVTIGQRSRPWDLRDARGDYSRRATLALLRAARRIDPQVVGAMLNVGGFRSDTLYPPGPVTNLDVKAIHPFDNRVILVTLTGQQLLDTLEHSCLPGSEGHGQGLILAGVQGRCDKDKPAPQYRVVEGRPVEILRHGQRVVDAGVQGRPIDMAASYTIATIDYLAKGGSGFLPLAQGQRRCADGKPMGNEPCSGPLIAEVIAAAVADGSLDVAEP